MSYSFNLPTQIVFGINEIDTLAEHASVYGDRILFICPQDIVDLAKPIIENLKQSRLNLTVIEPEPAEPSCQYIDQLSAELKQQAGFDLIIGFGGGSAMDLAKALSIALSHDEPIWLYANLSNRPPLALTNQPLPVITIPTTSGTGSEVTPYAVLANNETKQKGTIQEPAIFPKLAIVDASLLTNMPRALTASTAIDAFAHALEATINISKPAPMAELFGVQAMKIIADNLAAVLASPKDKDLRQHMAYASTLAGMAISHRGTTTTHAIAEPLGALTKMPHAVAVAVTTMPVMRHSEKHASAVLVRLDSEVFASAQASAASFNKNLESLINLAGFNKPLSAMLADEQLLGLADELVDNVMRFKFRPLKQHPIEWGEEGVRNIVNDLIHG
ncbi:iron-containing alcohol dehydrogenase [Dasania marina]|uniref:iron-containing alcohol dehydrogenase n=1 Tax=Dasania marina TaxID=471499 RepID=UPI0030DC7C75|tara:strand:- start:36920 stop:38086 length:1167 start_codon:yes stop_codon:yes gene_type:complete